MSSNSHTFPTIFRQYVIPADASSALKEIVTHLIADNLLRATFDEVCSKYGLKHSIDLKEELLDLVLFYIRSCLTDHPLTADEISNVHRLKLIFHIREGNLHSSRGEEINEILVAEIAKILSDKSVDPAEALRLVDLQRVFDLSYDQFLQLVREPIDKIVNELIDQITADGVVTPEDQQTMYRQIMALDTVYELSAAQKKRLQGRPIADP